MYSRRGLRIDHRQLFVQGLPAKARSLFFDLRTDLGIGGRHICQTFNQSLVIEHGAAHQQRNFSPCGDIGHGFQGVTAEIRSRIALGRVENIDQTMRILRQQLFGRLGGADVHATVDQRRIDADQFARQDLGEFDGQVGLAGGGRAHQENRRWELAHQRPRKNSLSRSSRPNWVQVGRPWLH
ncbi:hypothetical protein D3C71_1007430 [compost metagenome]